MKRRCLTAFILSASLLCLPALRVSAQEKVDLQAMKKQEEERRKKAKTKAKYVITDANINVDRSGGKPYSIIKLESSGGESPSTTTNKPGSQDSGESSQSNTPKTEEDFRKKKADLQKKAEDLRADIKQREDEIVRLRTSGYLSSDTSQQLNIANQITEMEKLVSKMKADLLQVETELRQLTRDARREGVSIR